jgi:hypothetical protein
MHIYYLFFLLFVVLSVFSEDTLHTKPSDSIALVVTANSSAQMGVLASGLPQNVFRNIAANSSAQMGVLALGLPQNEVFRNILPMNENMKTVSTCQSENLSRRVQNGNEILAKLGC